MRSRRLALITSWFVLGASLAVAIVLWVIATRSTEGADRVFGGGTGNFSSSQTHTNWLLAGIALSVAFAGLLVWAVILLKARPNSARAVMVATVVIGVLAVAGWAVAARLRGDDLPQAVGPRFKSVAEVVRELEGSPVECLRVSVDQAPAAFGKAPTGVCEIARRLALDDGLETVTIQMWRGPDARYRWYESVSPVDAVSVEGPTWLIQCEFETTCAQIQRLLGGRAR